jgi:hypothetical protein
MAMFNWLFKKSCKNCDRMKPFMPMISLRDPGPKDGHGAYRFWVNQLSDQLWISQNGSWKKLLLINDSRISNE